MSNYDFTTYSEEFDTLPEEDRAKYIVTFCCDNTINEGQAGVITAHTNRFSDYTFAISYFRSFASLVTRSENRINNNLLLQRCKDRVTLLSKQHATAETFSRIPNVK